MRIAILFAVVVLFASVKALAPLYTEGELVEGRYLVILRENMTRAQVNLHASSFALNSPEVEVVATYEVGSFKGFTAVLSPFTLAKARAHPDVLYVEAEQIFRISACAKQQDPPSWGLPRVSEINLNLVDPTYIYESHSGADVDAYIIDTGVFVDHVDFEGRAIWGTNTVGDGQNRDCHGHGTHVAGTVAGRDYGIAKLANVFAVKVLGCSGSGTTTGVVQGCEWVTRQYQATKRPSVANMSLGGGKSTAMNAAVEQSIAAGVFYAIAAGNSNTDACNFPPASVATAATAGATEIADRAGQQIDERAFFSNFGTCVHILAPGNQITSAWIGSPTAKNTISGTSMAAPHVCGVGALILSVHPTYTPQQVKNDIVNSATKGLVNMDCGASAVCQRTPNLLLHRGCK